MKKKSLLLCSLVFVLSACNVIKEPLLHMSSGKTELTADELVKISNAIDLSTTISSTKMHARSKHVFDASIEGFGDLFYVTSDTTKNDVSEARKTRFEISKTINELNGVSNSSSASASYPNVASVNAEVDAMFSTEIAKNLDEINDEYYEFFSIRRNKKLATIDWLVVDYEKYFSASLKRDYEKLETIDDAMDFISDFGTHIFGQYYLGGIVDITKYVVSETNIEEQYKNENKELSIKASVESSIVNAENDYSENSSNISGESVNNEQIRTATKLINYGGLSLYGCTIDQLFTYKDDFATEKGSNYVIAAWFESIDKGESLHVIDAKDDVPLWELFEESTNYNDPVKIELLKQAYAISVYREYAEKVVLNGESANYISDINYEYVQGNKTYPVSFSPSLDLVKIPSNFKVDLSLGEYITKGLNGDVTFELTGNTSATFSENVLDTSNCKEGDEFSLNMLYYGKEIYSIGFKIEKNSNFLGYGTKDQPFLVTSKTNFKTLNSSTEYVENDYVYEIVEDIDMMGEVINTSNFDFNGEIDGNGHTISNFNLINNNATSSVGLFSTNNGKISNLKIDNVRVLNNLAESQTNTFNIGVIAGINNGIIENVSVTNSSIRTNYAGNQNIGIIAGNQKFGKITCSGTSNCNIAGQHKKDSGILNIGGIVGNLESGLLQDCYTRYSNLEAFDRKHTSNDTLNIGYIFGNLNTNSAEDIVVSIIRCLSYENDYDISAIDTIKFGNIGGSISADKKSYLVEQCFYENTDNKSINNSAHAGCTGVINLTLNEIDLSSFNEHWTSDSNGKPIIKYHL